MRKHGKRDQDDDRPPATARPPIPNGVAEVRADRDGPDGRRHAPGRAEQEREAARERGRDARKGGPEETESGRPTVAPPLVCGSFSAVAEHVRDYAIMLTDAGGLISFWGEGARLMEWWTRDQAEGAHLRLLYPEGGSEDGAAEEHLKAAADRGEYVGEGRRVRADGSTFWAGVTLTALRDDEDALEGFAMVTRDLTARLAVESAVAAAGALRADLDVAVEQTRNALAAGEAHREDAEFAAEQARSTRDYLHQVLEPELEALRIEHANAAAHALTALGS